MAVVKANYVKRENGEKARAKATVRYIQHRLGQDGQTITRQLFGSDGPMDRQEAYRMIDEAKEGSVFYRLVLSPDPKEEDVKRDLDFRDLTEQTMHALEERAGRPVLWVAALHADHAPHRHVHVIAILPKRLNVKDFNHIRDAATQTCLEQRLLLDLGQTRERERPYPLPSFTKAAASPGTSARRDGPLAPSKDPPSMLRTCTCPRCRAVYVHSARDPAHQCISCGLTLHRGRAPALQQTKEAAWER
jgi:hypothetical protein